MDDFNLVAGSSLEAEDHIIVVDGLQAVLNQQLNAQVMSQLEDGANWPGNVMYILDRESASDSVVEATETSVKEDNVTLIEIKSDEKEEEEEKVVEKKEEGDGRVDAGSSSAEEARKAPSEAPPPPQPPTRMCTRSKAKGAGHARSRYSSKGIITGEAQKSTSEPSRKKRLLKKKDSDNKCIQVDSRDPLQAVSLSLFREKKLCDVTLISGEEQIQAHSLVLAAFSGLLHTILTAESDLQHHQISLDHLKLAPGCLEVLVNFMYTRVIEPKDIDQMDLIFAAGALSMTAATGNLIASSSGMAQSGKQGQPVTGESRGSESQDVGEVSDVEDAIEEAGEKMETEEEKGEREEEKVEEGETKKDEGSTEALKAEVDLVMDTIMAATQPADDAIASDNEDQHFDSEKMSALLNVDVKPVAEEVPRKRKKLGTGRPQKNKRFHQLKGTDGRYHCDFEGCEYSSAVLCNLVRHYRKHLDEKPFTCQKCGKSFKLKKYLTDHELTHSEERRFGCEVCGAQFRCDKHLSRHQKTHAVVKTFYMCQICNERKFKTEELLQKHISRVHLKEKTHQCPEEGCTYKAFTARQLRKHSDSRHCDVREAILCETCGRSFLTQQSMKAHILAFHEQRFFQCPHCPFKSGFRTGITSHIKRKHGLTPSGAIAKPNYKCDQCEFACFTKHEFKRHTLNHLGEKPFKCTECDFATVEKMNLKFHMRTHTGEKPYECPICHRKFPRTLGLRRHMLVHSGQKPHKCSECSMAYADKRSLESHQYSTHLQIKPFLCPHCTYACIRRENLNRHIKRCHPVDQELKMDDSLLAVKQELNPPASEVCIEAATQQLHQVYANQLGAPINLVFGADHQLDTVQLVLQQQQQQQQQ